MTTMYDEIGPRGDVAVASMAVQAHRDGRTCRECTDCGCEQLAQAEVTLAAHRRERAAALSR